MNTEAQFSFGLWLKRRRKGLDLTQAELALMLDCSVAAVRKFESEERRPSAQVVGRLMTIFGIPDAERTTFLRFARGDWYFSPNTGQEDSVWRVSEVQSPSLSSSIQLPSPPLRPRTNLPRPLSSFIGRERELAAVRRQFELSRLVTLTGAGGSGKTQIALHVVGGLLGSFQDGIWLVEFAPLADTALVPSAIASSLGMVEDVNRSILDGLKDFLGNRQVMLVLDNCEHLVETVGLVAHALLSHCPGLSILATSREPLGIDGENVWPVPALTMPPVDAQLPVESLGQYDAVKLFAERARGVLPTFELSEGNAAAVIQLCHRLDGLPLAIELTAARVKLLRVEQIIERLDDRFKLLSGGNRAAPPRHQSLQALIDWSHHLLSPAEQLLYRRLAVFTDGFTLAAVEAVCRVEDSADGLDILTQLVNKSLVTAVRPPGQEARYHLHETIYQHAWAKMEVAGEVAMMQERHAEYFCRQLEERLVWLRSADGIHLHRQWLETEYENLRSLMIRSLDARAVSAEWGVRAVTRLLSFWFNHGLMVELHRWLGAALEHADETAPATRAGLYSQKVRLPGSSNDPQASIRLSEALHIFRQLDDKLGIVLTTVCVSQANEDVTSAIADLEQVMGIAKEIGDAAVGHVHHSLSRVFYKAGLIPMAIKHGEEALLIKRGLGNPIEVAGQLEFLGFTYMGIGNYERAVTLLQESLALATSLGSRKHMARVLNSMGESMRLQQKFSEANDYFREALALAREMGDPFEVPYILANLGTAVVGQGDLSLAAQVLRESMEINRRSYRGKDILSWNLRMLAEVAERQGDVVRAAHLHGAAESVEQLPDIFLAPADVENIDRQVARVRNRLGEVAYTSAWLAGQSMSLEEIYAYALEEPI